MTIVKTSAAALVALSAIAGPALAFNEGVVNQTDVARVTKQVSRIDDSATRLQAQTLVDRAQAHARDGDRAHAAFALQQALDLAGRAQVAERAN
jgi:hypothetical protein